MYENEIEELYADIEVYRDQIRHHELWAKRFNLMLGSALSAGKRAEILHALDVQNMMIDAAHDNIGNCEKEIEYLKTSDSQDLETLEAYGSFTVDMRGEE